MSSDRRLFYRAPLYVPVVVYLPGVEGRFFLDGINLSEGGLFLGTDLFMEPGEKLVVEFDLPGADAAVKVECEVTWVNAQAAPDGEVPCGFGVRFVGLSDRDRVRVRRHTEATAA